MGYWIGDPAGSRTLSERSDDQSVVTQETVRDAFKRAAHEMSRDHPLGISANMFIVIDNTKGYAARAGLGWFSGNRNAPVHNDYLLARAKTGWIGEICMILLLRISDCWALRTAFRSRKDPVSGVALGCATAILVTALHNNFEFAWFTESIQRIFVVNLSLVYGCDQYWRLLRKQQRRELKQKAKDQMAESLAPSHI